MIKTTVLTALLVAMTTFYTAAQNTEDYDLDTLGFSITVTAPEGARIEAGVGNAMNIGGVRMYVYEINKGDFSLEISRTNGEPVMDIDAHYAFVEKQTMEDDFEAFVLREPHGFIYQYGKRKNVKYGMYYVIEKEDRFIEFNVGLYCNEASLESVRAAYEAAKTAR